MASNFQTLTGSILEVLSEFRSWNTTQSWDARLLNAQDTIEYSARLKSTECALSQTLCDVRIAMNALAPINRLPADVLQSIFYRSTPSVPAFLPESTLDLSNKIPTHRNTFIPQQLHLLQLLDIMSVCRRWRAVATSSTALWATIAIGPAFAPPSVVALQLQLSGNMPLDLHISMQTHGPEVSRISRVASSWDTLDFRKLSPRLRSFHLYSLSPLYHTLEQLSEPAPRLENLTLAPITARSQGQVQQQDQFSCVLPRLFQDETPLLKSLTISYFLSWPENSFRNLTRLCLSQQTSRLVFDTEDRTLRWRSRSQFFEFLNNSPRLEALILESTFFLREDDRPSYHTLRLPYLRTLILHNWDTRSSIILQSALELPPSCVVSIRPNGSGQDYMSRICETEAFPNMIGCLRTITRLYVRSRHLQYSTVPAVIACGEGGLFLETVLLSDHELMQLPISPEYARLYSTMNIEELWMDMVLTSRQGLPLSAWHQMYDSIPGTRKIVLNARYYLQEPPLHALNALGIREDSSPCFSDLRELHLVFRGDISEAPLLALQRIRRERAAAGVPIRKIVVGAYPPLELYEENVARIHELIGPEVICGVQDLSFNWSPFRERILESPEPYWPGELSGGSPGLWASRS